MWLFLFKPQLFDMIIELLYLFNYMYIIKLSIKLSLIATAIMSCCYFGTGLFINQDCYSLLIVSDAYKNAVSQIK